MLDSLNKLSHLLRYSLLPFTLLLMFTGVIWQSRACCLVAIALIYLMNLLYCFEDLRNRTAYFLFIMVFSVFLVWRPYIDLLRGDSLQYASDEAVMFSFIVVFIALSFLYLGSYLASRVSQGPSMLPGLPRKKGNGFLSSAGREGGYSERLGIFRQHVNDPDRLSSVRKAALIVFLFGLLCSYYIGVDKLMIMDGHIYEDYYLIYSNNCNVIIRTGATAMFYALCVFLALRPRKRISIVVLCLYISTTIPMVIIGGRGDFALAVAFAVFYFLMRACIGDDKDVWFGPVEKACLVALVPLCLLVFTYARLGDDSEGVIVEVLDMIRNQGVSYKVLQIAYDALPYLPGDQSRFFAAGPVIDYLIGNPFSTNILNTVDWGVNNSYEVAAYTHTFSHAMSYVAKPDYLQGHGWGSSYLLEFYADFGYGGVALANIVWGFFLSLYPCMLKNSRVLGFIALECFPEILWTPRSAALTWLKFIVTPQFWATIIGILLIALILRQGFKKGFWAANHLYESPPPLRAGQCNGPTSTVKG